MWIVLLASAHRLLGMRRAHPGTVKSHLIIDIFGWVVVAL